MPYHVRGHAENRKPHKDNDGLFGKHWNKDDWGNWIADRIAAQDTDILIRHGIQVIQLTVSATELYSSLPYPGQWYIGNDKGQPVKPHGVRKQLQLGLWQQYLRERDEYRRNRGVAAKWVHDSSMQHAADIYDLQNTSIDMAASKIRIIYDKGYHGGNRAKDDKLSMHDRLQTQACLLCHRPDSQDHWLHSCPHSTLAHLRTTIITELNQQLTAMRDISPLHRRLGATFKHIFTTTSDPARIWTANWSLSQINLMCNALSLIHI